MKWRGWLAIFLGAMVPVAVFAADPPLPALNLIGNDADPAQVSTALQILLLMTLFSLAPGLLIMFTSFT
ncbi:MAG: flagellar biosynthetic protein FliP, partial [Magnetococcales bacterium]|nr:flagellar biosynthetic protein FliP [Magnetococcales bacterium]